MLSVDKLKKESKCEVSRKGRSQFRDDIISKLKENNPDKKNIRIASREENSGITIEESDGTSKSYLLRTSNNIASDKSQGWFSIREELADKIINKELGGVIFYSYYGDPEKNIVVIMDSVEFKDHINLRGLETKDKAGNHHIYIEQKNNSIFEVRTSDIDISKYSNKYKI